VAARRGRGGGRASVDGHAPRRPLCDAASLRSACLRRWRGSAADAHCGGGRLRNAAAAVDGVVARSRMGVIRLADVLADVQSLCSNVTVVVTCVAGGVFQSWRRVADATARLWTCQLNRLELVDRCYLLFGKDLRDSCCQRVVWMFVKRLRICRS
jgi:hypothetical protein